MSLRMFLVLALLALSSGAWADDQTPSEAAVRELLTLTESQKMIDGIWTQMDSMMEQSMQQALQGQSVTEAHQAILADMRKEMIALMKAELSWERFEPSMIEIYQKTFTKDEVQGMVDFYKSPVGKAVTAKMPLVMQASMQATQSRMGPFQEKIRALHDTTIAKLREASKK